MLGRPARSAGLCGMPVFSSSSGLATRHWSRSPSTRITRSLSSIGGGRTRMARSTPSPTTSTRRLVSSRWICTRGYKAMKAPSMAATRTSSKATGQVMRTMPQGSAWVSAIASSAASASMSMALQCV
ncbi:hypothetical protein D3C78_1282290 [compost metagenome]